jgi:hypothetical protein
VSCQFECHVRIYDDFASYLRNGSVYLPAFFDAVCCGHTAPEQACYAAYPVHVFLFRIGYGLRYFRFPFL